MRFDDIIVQGHVRFNRYCKGAVDRSRWSGFLILEFGQFIMGKCHLEKDHHHMEPVWTVSTQRPGRFLLASFHILRAYEFSTVKGRRSWQPWVWYLGKYIQRLFRRLRPALVRGLVNLIRQFKIQSWRFRLPNEDINLSKVRLIKLFLSNPLRMDSD